MSGVSVIIPTLRRPRALATAVRSVFAQTGVDAPIEIVVVDNNPAGSAADTIAMLAAQSPYPFKAVAAPKAGVASARNAGWAAASHGLIAFLDDDEEAGEAWLARLLAARAEHRAGVVWGPVEARLPDPTAAHAPYLAGFFSRRGPSVDGFTRQHWGCGNCLIDRALLGLAEPPFDVAADRTGGEDDILFSVLAARRVRFAWTNDALVIENVTPERARLAYALKRAFAFGQGPSQTAAARGLKRAGEVAYWMSVGAAQAAVYGVAAAAAWAVNAPSRAELLDRAVQGAGKLLWFKPFAPELYGDAG